MTATNKTDDLTSGIPDPDRPDWRLVSPWPARAGFSQVVRHFLMAYVGRLQGERSTARQLAYWEGYQDAIKVAPTHDLTHEGAWQWHDDMVRCVGDCVAVFREKAAAEGIGSKGDVRRLRPQAPTTPAPFRRNQVS